MTLFRTEVLIPQDFGNVTNITFIEMNSSSAAPAPTMTALAKGLPATAGNPDRVLVLVLLVGVIVFKGLELSFLRATLGTGPFFG